MSLIFADASNDHVDHGSDTSIDDLQTWTKIFLIDFAAWTQYRKIFQKGRAGNADKRVELGSTEGDLSIIVRRGGVNDSATPSTSLTAAGGWQWLAITYDIAATSGQRITAFSAANFDSPFVQDGQGGVGTGAVVDASQTLRVGSNNDGTGPNARIAFFGQWNRVLTLGELKAQQFRPHVTGGCVTFTRYGFNGTGTQADWSGNGNSGAVTSATVGDSAPLPPPLQS